ncbi:MAG: hypothetical protein KC473_09350 [Candidatus Dadabacteria bacterium]|nr:hypothetical protein [Candidatus Dadabacteria bacterium]
MIRRLGELNSIVGIFIILTVTFFAIGGCSDNNGNDVIGEPTAGCQNISGASSGVIQTTGEDGCDSQIEDGCFSGQVSGSLNGEEDTIYITREEFDVVVIKFTELTGIMLITDSDGDQLAGQLVTVLDKDDKAGSSLVQWISEGSFGKYDGASGHMVQNVEIDFENKTYESTWSGELCLP